MSLSPAPIQREMPEVDGVQMKWLGQVGSQRGIELVAYDFMHYDSQKHLTTSERGFYVLTRIASGALMGVERRPYRPLQPLNFFTPGISVATHGASVTAVACHFSAQFMTHLAEIERDLQFDKIEFLTAIDSRRLTYLGQEMMREALSPGFGGALRAQAMGMEVALEITRCDGALRSEEPAVRCGLARWQTRRLEAYVREHLANDVTLTDLADLLGMSVRHLSRVVKQAKGRSVHCWVADLRIAEAQRLLAETNLPLHEIARRVAFKGAGAFSTAFRAASGFTPSDFRRLTHKVSATAAKAEP